MNPVLVLGIGNTLRSDDGAGVRAAELIGSRFPRVDVETVHQLTPDLAERIHSYQRVIITDASMRADEVTVRRLEPGSGPPTMHSHESSVEDLLAFCRSLYGEAPEEIVLVEIPVSSFEFGETLTPRTSGAVERAAELAGTYLSDLDL
jgi:hydrogenase maturation protease